MNTLPWRNATPEQINLWGRCNGLIAWVPPITPLYYQGAIAGSEFLTYNAGKLYIALEFLAGDATEDAGIPNVNFRGVGDAVIDIISNNCGYWNGAAVRHTTNTIKLENIYFFRIIVTVYGWMKFNGYRLNV